MTTTFRSILATGLLCLAALPSPAHAQGTAFAYHGRLNDNGQAANGTYDFRFAVFDAEADGAPVGQPVALDAVAVTAGQFTAQIDPGEGVFTGAPRWLEIGVRLNGAGGDHTLLAPRQALLPAPYAIYAGSAGGVANGTVTADQLNTGGLAPAPGQVLSYAGGNLVWSDPVVGGDGVWSRSGTDAYYTAGNVGIGTASPAEGIRLDVDGVTLLRPGGTGGVIQFGTPNSESGMSIVGAGAGAGRADLRFDGAAIKLVAGLVGGPPPSGNGLAITTNGLVGIGRADPQARLHLYSPSDSVTHLIETDGGVNAWAKVAFKNPEGQWDVGTSRGFVGDVFYVDRRGSGPLELALAPNGNLGLGVFPQAKLHLYDPVNSVSHRIQTDGGVNAWAKVEFANGNGQWNVGTSRDYNGDQLYFHRQGSANIALGLQPNGDAFLEGAMSCKVLTIRGGADVAEPFVMPEEIAKGSVVVIDDAHPGRLKLSTEAYDTRVAGIVSGADGINPGIALHQQGALEGGQNVALSGRVYVKADAAFGAIKSGDLLTTSATAGHAMKAADRVQAQGAILGKAMTSLAEGRGSVLVLVTLQ